MTRRGRKAALPKSGHGTDRGLVPGSLTVRCFSQKAGTVIDFDFSALSTAPDVQRALALAFARRTAPGGGLNAVQSFRISFRVARLFSDYVSALPSPPLRMADVTAQQIDGFHASRGHISCAPMELGALKALLLRADGIGEALQAKLHEANPPFVASGEGKSSYSRAEFKRIADAARSDLRAAAARIRSNRALLARFRAGELADPDRRLELLDWVDRTGDVPRYERKYRQGTNIKAWVQQGRYGSVADVIRWAHLDGFEASAGAVLLAVMTGENMSVILDTPAAHHRADGYTGDAATAILDTYKARRGARAYMNLVLSQVPDWISIPAEPQALSVRDELHTPFGLYALLLELTARSREITGSDRLLLGYHWTGGHSGLGRGFRVPPGHKCFATWADRHNLRSDALDSQGRAVPLAVAAGRIRLTYLQLHQKPVAHTETTLVRDYLGRDRGNLQEYRGVVAAALADQVDTARARAAMDVISPAELEQASSDPEAIAASHGVDAATLQQLERGELDTVMNACIDHENSPHAPAGQPCRASFMTCLECPCARALPRHLPIQVLVHDRLAARRAVMPPLAWVQRFSVPYAQLADLLARQDPLDVAEARANPTPAQRDLVERFVNRELDLR